MNVDGFMEYQRLLKNKNFLNTQNYVLGKSIIEKTKNGMYIGEGRENSIGFSQHSLIQEILVDKINAQGRQYKTFVILFFIPILLFVLVSYYFDKFNIGTFIFSSFGFFLVCLMTYYPKRNEYNFYRTINSIIIESTSTMGKKN